MSRYRSRPRRLRPKHLLCLRTSSHVWFDLDRESCAYRRWKTHDMGRSMGLLLVCGKLTPSAETLGAARTLCRWLAAPLSPRLHRKQSP
jgi:hypothetical protein